MSPIEASPGRVILLDIEGTTTPLDFVHQTLFGYARENMGAFLERNSRDPEVGPYLAGLKVQHALDDQGGRTPTAWPPGTLASETVSATHYGLWLMGRDSKLGALKTLQGLIWEEGYRSGRLKGQVFPDVPAAFDRWHQQGKDISIYSSGSALAQRRLFSSTEFGDLTRHISSFFDTQLGPKTSAGSYKRIASLKGCRGSELLFLSDTIGELGAARSAGLRTMLVVRTASNATGSDGHPVINSFESIG